MSTAPIVAREHWERRYSLGGNSGAGSRGLAARAKAEYINRVVGLHDVASVVDWGCGDGELLSLLDLEDVSYVGVEASASALRSCSSRCPESVLVLWRDGCGIDVRADLALSVDVLFHLPDDGEYDRYLSCLFGSADRYVLTHNAERGGSTSWHMRWRSVSDDVQARFPGWGIIDSAPGVNGCEFHLYRNEG